MSILLNKWWDNLDKGDQKFLINASCIGFIALAILYLLYYGIDENSSGKHVLFFIKSFGTIITVIGLSYAIYIQLKLKTITELLSENREQVKTNIANRYLEWNIQNAIGLTNEVETSLTDEKHEKSIILIRKLQENLTECKKALFVDYDKELVKCITCLDPNDKRTFDKIVIDCKENCNYQIIDRLKRNNKILSKQKIELANKIKDNNNELSLTVGLKTISDIRQILNEIKPSPINM